MQSYGNRIIIMTPITMCLVLTRLCVCRLLTWIIRKISTHCVKCFEPTKPEYMRFLLVVKTPVKISMRKTEANLKTVQSIQLNLNAFIIWIATYYSLAFLSFFFLCLCEIRETWSFFKVSASLSISCHSYVTQCRMSQASNSRSKMTIGYSVLLYSKFSCNVINRFCDFKRNDL